MCLSQVATMNAFSCKLLTFLFCILISNLLLSSSEAFPNAAEVDVDLEAATPVSATTSKWSDWLWSSSGSKAADLSTETTTALSTELTEEAEESSLVSASSILPYLGMDTDSIQLASDVYNMYYDPDNTSYMSMLSTFLKLLMFFMPGLGIVQQAYFTMDMAKITFKVAQMYFSGYETVDIATAVAPDLLKAVLLSRRDATLVSQYALHAGDPVNIGSMNAASFLNYVESMQFPRLPDDQEYEIRADVANEIQKYFPNILPEDQDSMIDAFVQTTKFLALFKPYGNIHLGDTSDSSSSEEEQVDRVFEFIRILTSNPKNFLVKNFRNVRNAFRPM